jgi:hypothetical protein
MKLSLIVELLEAHVVSGEIGDEIVETGFCSDLMSDVLTLDTERMLLITGMANLQTIRTVEMADIHWVLLVRNKKASEEMLTLANELGIVIIETTMSSFRSCGILYSAGLKPVY